MPVEIEISSKNTDKCESDSYTKYSVITKKKRKKKPRNFKVNLIFITYLLL